MNITMTTEPRGWSCPHCGKAHAPDVKTCPEPVVADCWTRVTIPTITRGTWGLGPTTFSTDTVILGPDGKYPEYDPASGL